jgi:hypothetical protein
MMDNQLTDDELREVEDGISDGHDPSEEIDIFGAIALPDGSWFSLDKDDLILQIVEDNAPMGNDNFEVEVFEVAPDGELIPMVFKKEPILIVNDILVDAVEEDDVEIDSTFVEYYFDLELDGEISSDIMCSKLTNADKDVYKYAFKEFACPDIQPNYQYLSPYSQKETDTECGD